VDALSPSGDVPETFDYVEFPLSADQAQVLRAALNEALKQD
jgi:hypothetical protein